MKVAVIGSRELQVANLGEYLPENTTEIISGGARGVDTSAREYAQHHGLKLTEYLPEYRKYGKSAPLKRNITIIENADLVLEIKGYSRGGSSPYRGISVWFLKVKNPASHEAGFRRNKTNPQIFCPARCTKSAPAWLWG